jgi:pilus assembly protein FimV
MDSSDALAEADIYIAYGRHSQARDLLRNALVNDPDNAAYRLKLVEAEVHLGNRPAAREQLYELETLGDTAAAARARELLGESESQSQPPAGLAEELGGSLESDFVGLEIEDNLTDDSSDLEDDLDLSADFADSPLGDDDDDEDLVIAADANGMSTKLDLARAYLDMGDEDGARQILEEVVAEDAGEYRSEAEALLERIG